jgi:hypothetical protein
MQFAKLMLSENLLHRCSPSRQAFQKTPPDIDIQQAFPDIGATVGGASKEVQIAGIQLTNSGWRVAGR